MNWFAKKVFDGGRVTPKKQEKSICYLSNIFKSLKYFANRLSNFLTLRREEELSRGAILIEFAVCMPILIILLFYIDDLVRIKRYYSQTEFVAQQFANIVQNISQKRTDKKIKIDDLRCCFSAAYLSLYPGTTMFFKGQGHEFAHIPYIEVYFVRGLEHGKASVFWRMNIHTSELSTISPLKIQCEPRLPINDYICSSVRFLQNVNPEQIHPSLSIKYGEEKIIVESFLRWDVDCKYSNGTIASNPKQTFKLYLASPNGRYFNSSTGGFFHSVQIFTPKPGLFNETPPS